MARMTKSQREELERCTATCVGRPVSFKYKGKSERFLVGQVEDVVSTIVADYNHMIQRIKLSPKTARDWGGVKHVYRTCYYTLSDKTRKPVFGQYATLVPDVDFHILARKANKKGWLGLS